MSVTHSPVVCLSLDKFQDGITFGKVNKSALNNGNVDLSQAGVVNKTTDNITDVANKRFVTDNQRTGAGYGYDNLDTDGIKNDKKLGGVLKIASTGQLELVSDTSVVIDTDGALRKNIKDASANILLDVANKVLKSPAGNPMIDLVNERIGASTDAPVIGYEGIRGGIFSTGPHARKIGTQTVSTILSPTSEYITNGGFVDGSGWTPGQAWTITGGVAHNDNTSSSSLDQSFGVIALKSGREFHWKFDLIMPTGHARLELRDEFDNVLVPAAEYTNGSHDLQFTTIREVGGIKIWADDTNTTGPFDIDNVSIKQESEDITLSNVDGFPDSGYAYVTSGEVGDTVSTWRVIYNGVDREARALLNVTSIGFRQYATTPGTWGPASGSHQLEDGFIVGGNASGSDAAQRIVLDTYDDSLIITDNMGQVVFMAISQAISMPTGDLTLGSGSTITGGIIRTSPGTMDKRIVIDGVNGTLKFYQFNVFDPVVTIDDNIWGQGPGISVKDGLIDVRNGGLNEWVEIKPGYLSIFKTVEDGTEIILPLSALLTNALQVIKGTDIHVSNDGGGGATGVETLVQAFGGDAKGIKSDGRAATANGNAYGLESYAQAENAGNAYAVRADAVISGSGRAWAAWFGSGDVKIQNKLEVDGSIHAPNNIRILYNNLSSATGATSNAPDPNTEWLAAYNSGADYAKLTGTFLKRPGDKYLGVTAQCRLANVSDFVQGRLLIKHKTQAGVIGGSGTVSFNVSSYADFTVSVDISSLTNYTYYVFAVGLEGGQDSGFNPIQAYMRRPNIYITSEIV